jgi:hypothetical protein
VRGILNPPILVAPASESCSIGIVSRILKDRKVTEVNSGRDCRSTGLLVFGNLRRLIGDSRMVRGRPQRALGFASSNAEGADTVYRNGISSSVHGQVQHFCGLRAEALSNAG